MKLLNRKRFAMLNKLWDICTIHMSRFHKAGVELKRMFTLYIHLVSNPTIHRTFLIYWYFRFEICKITVMIETLNMYF